MKKKSKKSFLTILGVIIIVTASILTLGVLSGELKLQHMASIMFQKLAFVNVGSDGVTVGGLSEQNAMWFGGIMIALLYLIGGGIVVKTKK